MGSHCCCGQHEEKQVPAVDPCGCTCECRCTCTGGGHGPPHVETPSCPIPDAPAPDGTFDVPAPPDPPRTRTSDVPPWRQDRPPLGDPGEIPWFRGKIGDIHRKGPAFGPRKDEFLPYLLVRAASSDRGGRPYTGVFWESPDVSVLPGVEAGVAPLHPATAGGIAKASAPNTLYAHLWNLGKAPASRVRVEFWWFDPSLGFNRDAGHLVGAAYVDLGDRFTVYPEWREVRTAYGSWVSRGAHAIVRCPETWVPTYLNGGHECLVVRVMDPFFDPVAVAQFSPSLDRHVGQRNIAVIQAASPATLTLPLALGRPDHPGDVGVEVTSEDPATMEWLKLMTGSRTQVFRAAAEPLVAGLLPPTPAGARPIRLDSVDADCRPQLLVEHDHFPRGCDPLQIVVHASVADLEKGEAHVLRVRQRVDGDVVGGYTVVLMKPP